MIKTRADATSARRFNGVGVLAIICALMAVPAALAQPWGNGSRVRASDPKRPVKPVDPGDIAIRAPEDPWLEICNGPITAGNPACDDGKPCTYDECVDGLCEHTDMPNGFPCLDDGNPCTEHTCFNGYCSQAGLSGPACEVDSNVCTNDVCVFGSCQHQPINGPCESDDNECTDDRCVNGACDHIPLVGQACQDDGNPCTDDVCDEAGECIHPPGNDLATCPDEPEPNPCTEDFCLAGECVHYPSSATDGFSCEDDGNVCTDNICHNGICTPFPGNEGGGCMASGSTCTAYVCQNGTCEEIPVNEGQICEPDGDVCTERRCANGVCGPPLPVNEGWSCLDDGIIYTDDVCNNGLCIHPDRKDGHPCQTDNEECTDDVCQNGACTHIPLVGQACTDDGQPCTLDQCNAEGLCDHLPTNEGAPCQEDGDPCTDDQCSGGSCIQFNISGPPCNDGDDCTVGDTCQSGFCAGNPMNCDDGNECTDDACSGGVCINPPNTGAACNDGDSCTVNDTCQGVVCEGTEIDCSDGDPCTADSCEDGQCEHGHSDCESAAGPCDAIPNPYSYCAACTVTVAVPDDLPLNCDDDNENGVADLDEPGPIVGENDLVSVSVNTSGDCPGFVAPLGETIWKIGTPGDTQTIRVYTDSTKSDPIVEYRAWPPPATVWIEGVTPSADCPTQIVLWMGHAYPAGGMCVYCGYPGDNSVNVLGAAVNLGIAGVDEAAEENPGGFIGLNDDEDEGKGAPDNTDASPIHDDGSSLMLGDLTPTSLVVTTAGPEALDEATISVSPISGSGAVRLLAIRPGAEAPYDNDWVEVPWGMNLRDDYFQPDGAFFGFDFYLEGLTIGDVVLKASVTVGTVTCEDKVNLVVGRVDLDGDANHNGLLENMGSDDNLEESLPGIIVLCNQDDDDTDGFGDSEDNIVNNGDANDLSWIVMGQIDGLPSGYSVTLTLEAPTNVANDIDASEVVRIFPDNAPDTPALLGPGTSSVVLSEDEPAHDVDLAGLRGGDVSLWVEGLEFAGEVQLRLEVVSGAGLSLYEDIIQLKVSPLLFLGHLEPVTRSYVSRLQGDAESSNYTTIRFPNATPPGIQDWIISNPLNGGNDQWAQDQFQIGYQESPETTMYVVIDSKRDRGLKAFPPTLSGPDFGYVRIATNDVPNTYDSFGNLEVSPPAGLAYPLGRVYFGDYALALPEDRMDENLRDFLARQSEQFPKSFDTEWLHIGHVDEFMSIIPNPLATHGWTILFADPVLALDILQGDALIVGGVDERLHVPKYKSDYGPEKLEDLLNRETSSPDDGPTKIVDYNAPNGSVYSRLQLLEAAIIQEFGLESSQDILHVPVLFDAENDTGKAVAITPNLVNSSVYSNTMIAPDPFLHASSEEDVNGNWRLDAGEDANANSKLDTLRDPFQTWLTANLPSGITVEYIDDWVVYHTWYGEVHCSANELREIPTDPKWWSDAP